MICYKDRWYCEAPCAVSACHRKLTPEVKAAAREWWGDKPDGPPIMVQDARQTCPDFMEEAS